MLFRLSGAGLALFLAVGAQAQEAAPKEEAKPAPSPLTLESYIKPPSVIEEAVMAPWHLNAGVSNIDPSTAKWLRVHNQGLPPLRLLAEPSLNLAGLQINVRRNIPRGWASRPALGLSVRSLSAMGETPVQIPAGVSPQAGVWSPDGRTIAFIGIEDDGAFLYAADPSSGRVRKVSSRQLNPVLESSIFWRSDSRAVAAVVMPRSRPAGPTGSATPSSPTVRVSDPATNRIRTFPSRLENTDEGALLRHHATGQVAVIRLDGSVDEVGQPGLIDNLSPSPSFDAFRVTQVMEPFLYTYPFSSFVRREAIWDKEGKELVELSKGSAPDTAPVSRPNDRRSLTWDPFGRGLLYLQKQPAPRNQADAKAKDQLILWKLPFSKESTEELWSSETDISSFILLPDQKRALVFQTINQETVASLATFGGTEAKKLYSFKPSDFYASPGSPVTKDGPEAGRVLRVSSDGGSFYLSGIQYSRKPDEEAPRPFVDQASLQDGKTTRIWQSRTDAYETVQLLDDDVKSLLVTRQSPTTPPNDYRVDRESKAEIALTANEDRLPQLTELRQERVQITRADGFKFFAEVTLPKYAVTGDGRKAFFWFYPNEVRSQATYDEGQRTRNKNTFRRFGASSPHLLALMGYVVVEPDVPILGPAERPNDTYVLQLRNSLSAVIDELDRRRLIDRRLLAVGGHSYGAFSTAHAMIQTPFFKAGIAGAGNYNRTLTPFGFQGEPRRLWEGRDLYLEMSPILRADQITGALLMYHGAEDQNVGTFPINSYRMFDALEALGKTAALYVYPFEDHGQIALETRLDLWARWIAWLEQYVKEGAVELKDPPAAAPRRPIG